MAQGQGPGSPNPRWEAHGELPEREVCRHLCEGQGLRYYFSKPWPDDPFIQAWCEGCDLVLGKKAAGVTVPRTSSGSDPFALPASAT